MARFIGRKFALAVNSCTAAILKWLLSVRAWDAETSAFTFTAVASTIERIGAVPILVEITEDLSIDLVHAEAQMIAHQGARVIVVSYICGFLPDIDALVALCSHHGVTLVEETVPAP